MKAVIDRRKLTLLLGILVAVIILITVWSSQKASPVLSESHIPSGFTKSVVSFSKSISLPFLKMI
ncbi:MAG TPA: hypothetical protein VD884_19580 [Ohtaekwangia sp.]|nr:hypothetical protein [Ohtaekwangia sp.]